MFNEKQKTNNPKLKSKIISFLSAGSQVAFTFLILHFSLSLALADPDLNTVLNKLEEKMAPIKTIQTDFIQEKNLALFSQKLILKGTISIQKPGMLAWRVLTPMRYSMVMNGLTISQWDEETKEVQSISITKNPSFQAAIDQMQNWFSGTYRSMLGDYKIRIISQKPLSLEFIPNNNAISSNFINRVTITFQDELQYVKNIFIEEKNGDSTLLTFLNSRLNQRISPRAWEVRS